MCRIGDSVKDPSIIRISDESYFLRIAVMLRSEILRLFCVRG